MKMILVVLAIAGSSAFAQYGANPRSVHVEGYMRSNGTYVQPYERTAPDTTRLNNYSTYGNVNPYNGQVGTQHVNQNNGLYGQ